ncbi:MAG: PD-(D/E)XK nuclease family protein [Bacteroidales bacterium]|nr:PD-(D/E)XK nuclease family protein [Bacteroidales bacterium]
MNTSVQPFLKSVAEYVFGIYGNNLHATDIVFPNKRARIFFNRYLSEITDKPLFAPKYYTISEFMQKLSGKAPADQFTLLFILYEVYSRITGAKDSFDNFLFYCEMLLADFDDIDKYLADAEMLFRNLTELKEYEAYTDYLEEGQIKAIQQFWETFYANGLSAEKKNFESLWMVLHRIYIEFNNELDKQSVTYEGKASREAIAKLEGNLPISEGRTVIFIGFNALNTCEYKLFKHLKNAKKALFFWDYDKYYFEKDFHEATFFLSKFVKEFPMPDGFTFESDLTGKGKTISTVDIPTQTGQTKALPDILSGLPANWAENPSETAIALADESLLMPVLTSLPANIADINISMGYPLKESMVYNFTQICLDLHRNKKCSSHNCSYYHKDIIRLIQHGFIRVLLNDNAARLSREIHKANLIYISDKWLIERAPEFNQLLSKNTNARNFISYLLVVMDMLPKAIETLPANTANIEKEALAQILGHLRRMEDVFAQTEIDFSYKSLLLLTGRLLRSASVPFSGEPLSGLQIMGILETRSLDFKNLIILSMNEGVFPKSGNVPSIIPYTLRKAFDMPTIEHQDAIYAYYFYRLLQRPQHVRLVYCSSVNDTKKGEASRFVQQLLYDNAFTTKKYTYGYKVYPQTNKSLIVNRNNKTLQILTNKYAGNNPQILSPSAINTYLQCQLRFYFRYVAGIPEPDEISEDIEANILGSILHAAMKNLYEPYKGKQIEKETIQQISNNARLIDMAIAEAFWEEYFAPEEPFPGTENVTFSGKNLLVKHVLLNYIKKILEYDSANTPLQIKSLEDKFVMPVTVSNNITVQIGGFIDRIDTCKGILRIIDYKTGKKKDDFKSVDSLFDEEDKNRNNAAFQVLLYSLVYSKVSGNENIQPALFFVREMLNNDYDPSIVNKAEGAINNTKTILPVFEQLLKNTLENIFCPEGIFKQTMEQTRCQFCPYKNICAK